MKTDNLLPNNQLRNKDIRRILKRSKFNSKPNITIDNPENKNISDNMVEKVPGLFTEDDILHLISEEKVLDLVDLEKLDGIGLPFLIEKLIPKWTITILGGDSATGKSTLALQISTRIIQSKPEIFGHKINANRKNVIYVSTEDGPIHLQYRLKKQLDPDFDRSSNRKNFKMAYNIDQLETEIKRNPVDLVIIDTLADFCNCDLNNNTEVRSFFEKLKGMIRTYGCTFLVIHHFGKSRKERESHKVLLIGTQAIEAAARQVLGLSIKNEDYRTLKILKDNYLSKSEKVPIDLRYNEQKMIFEKVEGAIPERNNEYSYNTQDFGPETKIRKNAPSEALLGKIRSLEAEGFNQAEIAKEIGKSPATICRYMKR